MNLGIDSELKESALFTTSGCIDGCSWWPQLTPPERSVDSPKKIGNREYYPQV
jgi:hypothetical protein